jgi:hypothetical protein
MSSPEGQDRINELEAKVAELSAIVARMASPSPSPVADLAVEDKTSSRRNMLKLAGAAAVGAVGAGLASSTPAAAIDPNDLTLGVQGAAAGVNATAGLTRANYTGAAAASAFVFQGGNVFTNTQSNYDAVLASWANNSTQPHGFYGWSNQATGHAIVGNGQTAAISGVYGDNDNPTAGVGAGVRAYSSNGPTIQLEPALTGVPAAGTWTRGALVADTAGNLWYCTVGGTPGTWVNLSRALAPLQFFPLTPYRAYDSREPVPAQGALAMGNTRTIVIKDQRAVTGGAVTTADRVPAGATAITANITVVNTVSAGFLTANPGGNTTVSAATINWFASGQILNNGVTLAIGAAARDLTVIAGGSSGASTDFVIDVTGYFAPAAV